MHVRRDRLAEFRQRRIGITLADIAEDLVVGAVFTHDVDHVLDVMMQEFHHRSVTVAFVEPEIIVLRHDMGQPVHLGGTGHRHRQETRLRELQNIVVAQLRRRARALGIRRDLEIAGVRSGVALAVDDIEHLAVGADADAVRKIAGRQQADHFGPGCIERDYRDRIGATIGHVQAGAVRRQGEAVGLGAVVIGRQTHEIARRRGMNGIDHFIARGRNHLHVGFIVARHVKQRAGRVEHHAVGVAGRLDPRGDGGCAAQRDHVDLTIPLARHIGRAAALDRDPIGVFAAGHAILRGVDDAGAQRHLGHSAARQIDHRKTVVIEIRDHQLAAVLRHRESGRLRLNLEPVAAQVERRLRQRQMTQRDRRALLGPDAVRQGKRMDIVGDTARDIEMLAIRREGDAHERVGHLQHLLLHRRAVRNIIDEHVFVRSRRNHVRRSVFHQIIAAGQDQQGLAIRADRGGHRLAGRVGRERRKARVQRAELRAGCHRGCDGLAARGQDAAQRNTAWLLRTTELDADEQRRRGEQRRLQ